MNLIIFLITWFLSGVFSFIFVCIVDMRNKEYDENYFYDFPLSEIILLILFGYYSIFVVFISYIIMRIKMQTDKKDWSFTRLMYNIANIGVKKEW